MTWVVGYDDCAEVGSASGGRGTNENACRSVSTIDLACLQRPNGAYQVSAGWAAFHEDDTRH